MITADLSSIANETWIDRAICPTTAPNQFFAEKGGPAGAAKRVCAGCPVTQDCLEFALRNKEMYGIWGGASPKERRQMLRGAPATPPPLYNPSDYTRADGHGFRGYKRGCTCKFCLDGYARYQRDYQRRSGLRADRFCQQCSMLLSGSGRTRYCGEECRRAAKAIRNADRRRTLPPQLAKIPPAPKQIDHECAWCETEFKAGPRAKYCSLNCRVKAHNHRKKTAA
jgi:WhiB family transcriptional regulator, redox-sensing transcriptional regulator